jgi:GNAT superfamily N-acetyltransferase
MRMRIREATLDEIPDMFGVRSVVEENWLSEDDLRIAGVTRESVRLVLETVGRAWVAEHDERVVGYSIANAQTASVWALFVLPEYEGMGLGRSLLDRAVSWLWSLDVDEIWLQTGPDLTNRAHAFYQSLGWRAYGRLPNGDTQYVLGRTSSASSSADVSQIDTAGHPG